MIQQGNLRVSSRIVTKLREKHDVSTDEVWECFYNRVGSFLEDTRVSHRTEPPTMWFIASTDSNRRLKVVFIENDDGTYEIKTAYEPNDVEETVYGRYSSP